MVNDWGQQKKQLKIEARSFTEPLSQKILNIEDKSRSNIFTWRGQFSPQLIEDLLLAYCPSKTTILDPFSGSGTVLYEAGCFGLKAYGCEINPAAWIFSRTYQMINISLQERQKLLDSVFQIICKILPEPILFEDPNQGKLNKEDFLLKINSISSKISEEKKMIFEAWVTLLDSEVNLLTKQKAHETFYFLKKTLNHLPYSANKITALLADARNLPLKEKEIDFIITSPPYINVFNYHQNYRTSVELLGWDLLKIAKSEIGSNRANRGNRFFTVVQYCLDLALVLQELYRVCTRSARVILVVGYESCVLGVPFFNANIICDIVNQTKFFQLVFRQKREFKNKFGKIIREDLLHLEKNNELFSNQSPDEVARKVAFEALKQALEIVSEPNKEALKKAITKIDNLERTPIYKSF